MDLGRLEYDVAADTTDLERAEQRMGEFSDAARKTKADVDKLGGSLNEADSKAGKFSRSAERMGASTTKATTGVNKTRQSLDRAGTSASKAANEVSRLSQVMQVLAGSLVVREIIRYSDAWNNAANQLRQVTDSTRELADMQQTLMSVANETRTAFTSTANLYSRLARSTTEMALSSADLVDITRTINQSFAVSGATAEEASAAIVQLSQGLAAGALRGDEFNSVAEQAPGILRAVAESVGMNIGQLREFAAEGGITAEIVVNALQEASGTIEGQFSKSVATFGQQMVIARNNMQQLVGESDQLQDAIRTLGGGVVSTTGLIRDNSEAIFTAASAAAGAGSAYAAYTTAVWAATAAQKAFNLATRANPLVMLVTTLGAAAGALYAMRDATLELEGTTATVTQWMQGAWEATSDAFSSTFGSAIETVDGYFGEFGTSVGKVVEYISGTFMALLDNIAGMAKVVINNVIAYFLTLRDTVGIVAGAIRSQFASAFESALAMGRAFWEDLTGIFEGDFALDSLRGAITENLVEPLSSAGGEIAEAFNRNFSQDFVGGAVDFTANAIEQFTKDVVASTQRASMEFKTLDEWLLEVPSTITKRTNPALEDLGDANSDAAKEAERLEKEMQGLLDTLYPLEASQREYARSVQMVKDYAEENNWTHEKLQETLSRLEKEYQNAGDAAEAYGLTGSKAAKEVEEAVGPMAETFERGIERMDDAGVDMWRSFLDGTNDAMESFENIVIDMLAEVAHNLTTRQLVVPIQAAITGEGQGTASIGGQGGMLSTENLISGGKSLYGQVSGGGASSFGSYTQAAGSAWRAYQGIGSTYSGTFGSSLGASSGGGLGAANASLANGALGGIYTAGAGMAGTWAGSQVGGAISDKQANSNYGATAGTAIGAYVGSIVPVIGTALGAAIGGFIGSVGDTLFGSENSPPKFEYEQRTGGGTAYEWGGRNTPFSSTGTFGFEISKMEQESMDALDDFATGLGKADEALAKFMTDDQISRVQKAMDSFDYEGLSTSDLLADRLDTILTAADMHGPMYDRMRDEYQGEQMSAQRYEVALNIAALESVLTQVPENVANHVDHYMAQSDGGIKALTESLLIQIQQWDALGSQLEQFVPTFDRLAEGAVVATNGVNDLAGGVENLTAMHSSYYDAFFTDAEKFEAKAESLSQQFEAMGVTLPETREGVRDLVEGLDLMTVAGREQYVAIMSMVPALDEYVQGMEQQRQAAEAAAEQQKHMALEQRAILQQRAIGDVQAAYEQLQATVESQQSSMQDALQATMDDLNGSLSGAQSEVSRLSSIFDTLGRAIESTRVESEALTRQRREDAQGFLLSQMAAGRITDEDALRDALSVVSEPAEDMFSTLADFAHDQLVTQNVIKAVQDNTGENLTAAEKTVRELQNQIEAEQRMHEQSLERLDAQLEADTAQIAAELGSQAWLQTINTSVLSMADAIAALDVALSTAGGGTSGGGLLSGVGSVESIYQDVLGRASDAGGLAYYTGELSSGRMTLDEIRARIADSPEAKGVPGYANGGSFGGGVRMVGERGPELEFTGPSRIMNNGDVRGMLDNTELTEEVKAMRRELKFTQSRLVENSSKTQRSVETIEFEGVFIREEETA